MNEPRKQLTDQQSALVAELTQTYAIEQKDILFFSEKPEPFFSYEATCVLCNDLCHFQDIDIEPVYSVNDDSLAVRCHLLRSNGQSRSATGVANLNEQIDGKEMSVQQIFALASARAIRNALKTAGIDLMKLYYRAVNGDDVLEFKPKKSNYQSLLAQAHTLGKEVGVIQGENSEDKRVWYSFLLNRYQARHSNELSELELSDFCAFLKSLSAKPTFKKAA